jgi:hypothetical protein
MSTKPVNVEDYRILAQRRLPRIIFDYLEGGSDDETGLKHNHEVFERYRLMPRRLVDVSKRDIGIELWATSGMTARGMSASPPIATELWHRSEMTRCAIRGLMHRSKIALLSCRRRLASQVAKQRKNMVSSQNPARAR